MTLAAVLCCALAFTACQKNNDTNTGNKENEETADGIAKVDVFYKFMTTDDLLEYFDFKLEYLDVTNGANGKYCCLHRIQEGVRKCITSLEYGLQRHSNP